MDTGSLLLILSLALLAGLYVARPFFSDTPAEKENEQTVEEFARQETEFLRLLEEKDRILYELQELETDHYLGKVMPEDYPHLRDQLKTSAAAVLQNIEEFDKKILDGQKKSQKPEEHPSQPRIKEDDEIEEMIAARRRLRDEKSAGFCPHCGKVIRKSDVYCPACGSKVA